MKRSGIMMIALIVMISTGAAFAANEKPASEPAVKKPSIKPVQEEVSGNISGKVVETMNASGYTYVCVEKKGKKTWVAVPEMKVAVGSKMSFQPGSVMPNFTSKTLNRTFDSIVFSGGPVAAGGQAAPGMPGVDPTHPGSKANVASLDKNIKVEKAAGDNAYTIGETYAKSTALNSKQVAVKGKVVKFSQGIMGKNWLHIQDGSGDQQKGTHDLVATTQDTAAVGDIVTVTGTFAKDKDFGAGYNYKAIIEDAKVQK
ncbi:MAG: DNA-binding protein [Nitrospirae bacterium]|nr:DNA-binding protein [Nitrospirota bacterium]NTW67778.1 DNA-binding protein [Nitrospirota bacterium]